VDCATDLSTKISPDAAEAVDGEDVVTVVVEAGGEDAVVVGAAAADQVMDLFPANLCCFNVLDLHQRKSVWAVDRAGLRWSCFNDPSDLAASHLRTDQATL
jgi:hypothetical protein